MANTKNRQSRETDAGRAADRGSGANAASGTGSRTESPRKGANTSTLGDEAEEFDGEMLCDNGPCTCEEADVVRGARRFCSVDCADASAEAEESVEATGQEIWGESCICGHAECEASVSAGAGEGRGAGRQPSRTPPGRG